jgi:hypothetical protein
MNKNVHDIENILNSFDGMKRAEVKSFFTTRVVARLEKVSEKETSWMSFRRPALVIVALSFFFAMNVYMIVQQVKQTKTSEKVETTGLQNFAGEYHLNETSNY